jgi:hypothetical protein
MPARNILKRAIFASLAAIPVVAIPVSRLGHAPQEQQEALVDLHDFTPREHRVQAFVLTSPQTLRVMAVGAEPGRERRGLFRNNGYWGNDENRDVWPAAAWILDVRTRAVVWDLRTAETERARSGLRRFDGAIRLPTGTYEVHYASFPAMSVWYEGDGDFRDILRRNRQQEIRYAGPYVDDGEYRQFRVVLQGAGRPATQADLDEATRAGRETAIASLRPERGASQRYGFALSRQTRIDVTGLGEMGRDDDYDYGWIANAETGEQVWRMNYSSTEPAGGVHKNRQVRTSVSLGPGRYVAYFVSDDSHDPDEWNGVPPLDPDAWGLTLHVGDASARAAVESFVYEPVPSGQTIVSITGVGDDEVRSEGFTLSRPMDVRIYAMGEGRDGEMFDYGWIVDAGTRRRVWTMRHTDTQDAGGDDKNRLFNGTLRLEAGSYVAYYKTDGSHSSAEWNATAPAEGQYWGMSIFPATGQLDRSAVQPFQGRRQRGDAVLAELVRMGDHERARATFRLERETRVRIYALGEGSGEMYDYAWLEDARTRRVVWEMTYRTSEHAGGASKNRMFEGTLVLGPGEYVLRYESDGSHSYEEWNADPPDDPDAWGVTVTRAGN